MNTELKDLLERLKKGDEAAWAELDHRYRDRLRGLLLGRGLTRNTTSDVIQEALLKFRQWIAGNDPQRLSAVLLTFAKNAGIDEQRRRRGPKTASTEDLDSLPGGGGPTQEQGGEGLEELIQAVTLRHLQKLSEKDQKIVLMRAAWDMEFPEIGSELGMKADAVRMKFKRAMERLRETAGPLPEELR